MQAGENQPQPRWVRPYTGEFSKAEREAAPGRLPEDTWRQRAAPAGRRSRSLSGDGSDCAAHPAPLLRVTLTPLPFFMPRSASFPSSCSAHPASPRRERCGVRQETRRGNSSVAAQSVLGVRGTHRNQQAEPSSTEDLVSTEIRGKHCLPYSVHTQASPDSLCFHLYFLLFHRFIPF